MVLIFIPQQRPAVIYSDYRVFSSFATQNNACHNSLLEGHISFMKLLTLSQVQMLDCDLERLHSWCEPYPGLSGMSPSFPCGEKFNK